MSIIIDFTTIVETVGTPDNYALKYADGTMIAVIKKTVTLNVTAQWGSLYQTSYSGSNLVFADEFYSAPAVTVSTESTQTLIIGYEGSATKTHAQSLTLARPQSASGVSTVINVVAIGRWTS